jgi:type 1 fimbriae regulatory protein FimB/type 1 fimbriae regulatory protein FimE
MKNKAKKARRERRPTSVLQTVRAGRARNSALRPREYLTPKEVELLMTAAKKRGRRYGLRDATMILIAYRHGLRVSELCALCWDQIDFQSGKLHVRRLKNGMPSVHLIGGEELRALRALKRDNDAGRFIFMTERGAPMTRDGFLKLVSRLGVAANFPFPVHPHMLRHATGYKLANDGQDMRRTLRGETKPSSSAAMPRWKYRACEVSGISRNSSAPTIWELNIRRLAILTS